MSGIQARVAANIAEQERERVAAHRVGVFTHVRRFSSEYPWAVLVLQSVDDDGSPDGVFSRAYALTHEWVDGGRQYLLDRRAIGQPLDDDEVDETVGGAMGVTGEPTRCYFMRKEGYPFCMEVNGQTDADKWSLSGAQAARVLERGEGGGASASTLQSAYSRQWEMFVEYLLQEEFPGRLVIRRGATPRWNTWWPNLKDFGHGHTCGLGGAPWPKSDPREKIKFIQAVVKGLEDGSMAREIGGNAFSEINEGPWHALVDEDAFSDLEEMDQRWCQAAREDRVALSLVDVEVPVGVVTSLKDPALRVHST